MGIPPLERILKIASCITILDLSEKWKEILDPERLPINFAKIKEAARLQVNPLLILVFPPE